jgi:CheY-like chemotaxis protein/anti-sigma regulatory factor (Ser/Thr protein kinase)
MRASQVVKDLLAFARRSETQQAPLDINGVVSRTLRMRQYQFSEAAVRAMPDLAEHLPSVMGDARQLQQVCLNLLTNAVQAMSLRGGGTLQVRTYAAEGTVRLEVADSGPGILPEARAHIFEPFFTTKKEGEGTGLGLSVSYGIVTAHGGTIEVVDTGAHGTTFRVSLPAASAPANAQEATREPPLTLRSPLAGIKLLFADDEPALRSGMQAFGALRGFTVLTASDGAAALETARTTGVDAVVCDLRMPGMDGFAFHEQLRRERPGLAERTVFITGDVVTVTSTRGSTARQPVLTKPFAFDRIEEALIAVMRGAPYVPATPSRG